MFALANNKSREELLAELQAEQFNRVTLSFYRYVHIENPKELRDSLYKKFTELNCRGRIYLAREGINAQMNVPEHNWTAFDTYIQSLPVFVGIPYKIAVQQDNHSFLKLTIKVKEKIVADGITDPSFESWTAGEYLSPKEFNALIENPDSVIVDMRNAYEAEVGKFEKALVIDVDTFRDELKVAEQVLEGKQHAPIGLYCTGGIRCEKASAWLKHKGFKNVRHLRGGIIDYARVVQEESLPNKFHGKNFVFDERLGERISDEVIAHCHICKTEKADTHYHCKRKACHVLYISCDSCIKRTKNYCSFVCRLIDALPRSLGNVFDRHAHSEEKTQFFRKNRIRST